MDWVNKHLQIEPINTSIDPIFPVENAIITHAHADHAKPGHKNVLATKHTIEIMKIRYGENCANNFQELSFNSPLNINGVKVTFFPAGHILGSTQVLLEYKKDKINFTGDFKITKDDTCENFRPVNCDTLVTEATFGLPIFQHPDPEFEINKLIESIKNFPNRPHLIGVYALGKAQRLIKLLRNKGYDETIFIHGALEKICNYYIQSGINLGNLSKALIKGEKKDFNGKIILAPPSALKSTWSRRFIDPILSHASGWMLVKQRAKQSLVELPLLISDHADWNELTSNINNSLAKNILVTHGREEALVHWCKKRGLKASALSIQGRDDSGEEI